MSDNKTAKVKKPEISIFKYVIKLGDFYFYDSAISLKQRVKNEFKVNEVKINKLSKTKFRVYLGPYDNLNSLKNGFVFISKNQSFVLVIKSKQQKFNFNFFASLKDLFKVSLDTSHKSIVDLSSSL